MGAAASLSHIPENLLEETHLQEGATCLQADLQRQRQAMISNEVLQSIRRKSLSDQQTRRRYSVTAKQNNLNKIKKVYELPPSVTTLLTKIGINNENDKTVRLVSHIFECLDGLHHLVNEQQSTIMPNEQDETQSTSEVNTRLVGRVLHEMLTIYSLCGSTIKVLLETNPEAAVCEDNLGRLPLHVSLDQEKPWIQNIYELINAYPEALGKRDGAGRLPLHVLLDRPVSDPEIALTILKAYPDAAAARRGVGRVAIHYAASQESPSLSIIQRLHELYAAGVKSIDLYGRIPLHYAVDKMNPSIECVMYLLSIFKEGAAIKDTHNRSALMMAIDKLKPNLDIIKVLYTAYPSAITECGPSNKLSLQIAVEAKIPHVPTIYYLAKLHPEAILTPSKTNGTDTPYNHAKEHNQHLTIRAFLQVQPSIDPALFKRCNWEARKIAFLLLKGSVCEDDDSDDVSRPDNHKKVHLNYVGKRICNGNSINASEVIHLTVPSPSGVFKEVLSCVKYENDDERSRTEFADLTDVDGCLDRQKNLYKMLHYSSFELFRICVMYL